MTNETIPPHADAMRVCPSAWKAGIWELQTADLGQMRDGSLRLIWVWHSEHHSETAALEAARIVDDEATVAVVR